MEDLNLILALGHIIFGGYFFYMGLQHLTNAAALTAYAQSKHVPYPKVAVYISGLMIFLGGIGLIAGRFVAVSSILIILFLIPVTLMMHAFWKETDPGVRIIEQTQFLKNAALLGAALIVLATALA